MVVLFQMVLFKYCMPKGAFTIRNSRNTYIYTVYWRESVGSFEPGNENSETALLTTTFYDPSKMEHIISISIIFLLGEGECFLFA